MEAVPLDDRGLLLGDGLFETLLARSGDLVLFDAHLARMVRGCAVLGLPAPAPSTARALCEDALAAAGLAEARAAVRLTLTAGSGGRGLERPPDPAPRLFATAAPAARVETPARLIVARARRNAHSPAASLKTLSYLDNVLARREAVRAGADEAVMLNGAGEIACAAAANLFWIARGRVFTPRLDCGALGRIVRGALIAAAGAEGLVVEEARAGREALDACEAALLTNSLIGARPVGEIDGRALATHPLAARLARLGAAYA